MSEEARLRQELLDLDQRRVQLDRKIEDAVHRQRYAQSPHEVDKATGDERSLLVELDRLMTRIRAVEGQLLQLQKRPRR